MAAVTATVDIVLQVVLQLANLVSLQWTAIPLLVAQLNSRLPRTLQVLTAQKHVLRV